jgi:hypothetical protein
MAGRNSRGSRNSAAWWAGRRSRPVASIRARRRDLARLRNGTERAYPAETSLSVVCEGCAGSGQADSGVCMTCGGSGLKSVEGRDD